MFTFLSFYSAPLIPNSMSLQNMQIGNLSRGECNAGFKSKSKNDIPEGCIFSVVCFQSLKCDGLHSKKISVYID